MKNCDEFGKVVNNKRRNNIMFVACNINRQDDVDMSTIELPIYGKKYKRTILNPLEKHYKLAENLLRGIVTGKARAGAIKVLTLILASPVYTLTPCGVEVKDIHCKGISVRLGVNVTSVRRALRILKQESVIFIHTHKEKRPLGTSYYEYHRRKIIDRIKDYRKTRMQTDLLFSATLRLRSTIRGAIRNRTDNKIPKTNALLGCSISTLLQLWGVPSIPNGFHIDHIVPCAQATTIEELEKLQHFSNLRLLPAKENIVKGAKKTEEGVALCRILLGREWIDNPKLNLR